jgi:hypothetical protein
VLTLTIWKWLHTKKTLEELTTPVMVPMRVLKHIVHKGMSIVKKIQGYIEEVDTVKLVLNCAGIQIFK